MPSLRKLTLPGHINFGKIVYECPELTSLLIKGIEITFDTHILNDSLWGKELVNYG
eukprot:Pgem_evm1s10237